MQETGDGWSMRVGCVSDVFLIYSCLRATEYVRSVAHRQAEVEGINDLVVSTAKQLQESSERTEAIVQTALDAVITYDANGIITRWNRRAEAIFGFTSEQAKIGRASCREECLSVCRSRWSPYH